jgi:hypothetical protein
MPNPLDNFYQNPSIGGTPEGMLPIINTEAFNFLIHSHWDSFEHFWTERLHMVTPLYAVEICFNAEIYLSGQGSIPAFMTNVTPQFGNFTGHEWKHMKKEIAAIADSIGIVPVTVKNARMQLPNVVYITNPNLPKLGESGRRERGGKYSNL